MKDIVINLLIGIVSGLIVYYITEYIQSIKKHKNKVHTTRNIVRKMKWILIITILAPFFSMLYTSEEDMLYLLNLPSSVKITMSLLMTFYVIVFLKQEK